MGNHAAARRDILRNFHRLRGSVQYAIYFVAEDCSAQAPGVKNLDGIRPVQLVNRWVCTISLATERLRYIQMSR